jgi:hypothetical protein
MAITTEEAGITLSVDEHRVLLQSQARSRETLWDLRWILISSVLVLVATVAWSLWERKYGMSSIGVLTFIYGFALYSLRQQNDIAINLIRKLQGNPHQGRRAIDTAIPIELSEQ